MYRVVSLSDSTPNKPILITDQEAKILDLVRGLRFGKVTISKEGGRILPVKLEISTDTATETIKIIKT